MGSIDGKGSGSGPPAQARRRSDGLDYIGRKYLEAKAKHNWLSACAAFRGFADQPGVLRSAIVLFELYDAKIGYAWPSRDYLCERLRSPRSSVSEWTGKLENAGAIEKVPVRFVEKWVLKITRRRASRAQYYRLNFSWADEVLRSEGSDL